MQRATQLLRSVIMRRVIPYFKGKKGTDPALLFRVGEHLSIQRLEDEDHRIRAVSFVTHEDQRWRLFIHERVFDYLAFVIPIDPDSRLGGRTPEEGKILAFFEFLLHHEIGHMLYPQKTERETIHADVAFALDRRVYDPTYYRMLRQALADDMTGLQGQAYLEIFDAAEQQRAYEYLITRMLTEWVGPLSDIPENLMKGLFPVLDSDLKTRVLGEFYRRSRDTGYSLLARTRCLLKVMRLFAMILEQDEKAAKDIFDAFKDRWGLIFLFHEMNLPESSLEDMEPKEIFVFFKDKLKQFLETSSGSWTRDRERVQPKAPDTAPAKPKTRPLKDRIEGARNDPAFPRQAMAVIDKNKTSAVGHSGPKYTELIETLLAIPWGKIQDIKVSPGSFEEGLNQTHYGLKKPKEIICDFFINLIWRFQQQRKSSKRGVQGTGSAFLFVGPPGVGKTSLALSIARNLGIPYHKISLGGMRDEAYLKGHGFTYEGSKPGAIVQGLIKMDAMNGMFIMDEADKTEKFAIATLLEILDPEQNHLFQDKYTQTTVDVDLSNCHFILTANTLETVPAPVINRCEVVVLDRYSVEEKIAIAQHFLIQRVRRSYQIAETAISFDPDQERALLKQLIKTYTYEPGVRQLERIIRTLFLRLFRKEILMEGGQAAKITRSSIKQYLGAPKRHWRINEENRVGEMLALGVSVERGTGAVIPVQATPIRLGEEGGFHRQGDLSMVHATGNIEKIMDESRKVATTGILHCAEALGIEIGNIDSFIHLHFMGSSTPKDGPSAGGAIALALASVLSGRPIRRDVAMTGEIDTHGRITAVAGLDIKLETAIDAGCKTMVIPKENLGGDKGLERFPDALKNELQILTYRQWKGPHPPFDYEKHLLQVVAVDHVVQAAEIAFINLMELKALEERFAEHGRFIAQALKEAAIEPDACFTLLYAKHPVEFDQDRDEGHFWETCNCVFLARSEFKKNILKKYPSLKAWAPRKKPFPSKEDIEALIGEIKNAPTHGSAPRLRLSLVAPYFFLQRSGLLSGNKPSNPALEGLRFFANNFTAQGIKIKACKPLLNRVYCRLAPLAEALFEGSPFLTRKNGSYVINLECVPEKYRLDIHHAQEIINRSLAAWLEAVDEGLKQPLSEKTTP